MIRLECDSDAVVVRALLNSLPIVRSNRRGQHGEFGKFSSPRVHGRNESWRIFALRHQHQSGLGAELACSERVGGGKVACDLLVLVECTWKDKHRIGTAHLRIAGYWLRTTRRQLHQRSPRAQRSCKTNCLDRRMLHQSPSDLNSRVEEQRKHSLMQSA